MGQLVFPIGRDKTARLWRRSLIVFHRELDVRSELGDNDRKKLSNPRPSADNKEELWPQANGERLPTCRLRSPPFAEGVLKTMLLMKLRVATTLLLPVVITPGSDNVLTRATMSSKP